MEIFLFTVTFLAFLVSGAMSYFLKTNVKTYIVSTLAPIFLLVGYILLKRDEFGYWALLLTFAVCCSLVGSAAGVLLSKKLKTT